MRLVLLRVRDESTLPPLILQPGDSVSQDVKCFSVGQRLRSVPDVDVHLQPRVLRAQPGQLHLLKASLA